MTLWKVMVLARHRSRYAKSHKTEDALVSYLFTRTKREGSRWAALETIVVVSRYDRGGDFYWDDARSVEETEEMRAPRRRRKWKGWPAAQMGGVSFYPKGHAKAGDIIPIRRGEWYSTRTLEPLTAKEARRRNRISLTRRKRRRAREAAEAGIPEAEERELNIFYREFKPYPIRDAFAAVEPPGYEEQEGDEDVIERLHEEYDELEGGGSPSGA